MRDPTSPRFQSNFAIRHGQVSGNLKRQNYRHDGTIDTVNGTTDTVAFTALGGDPGVVRCLFLCGRWGPLWPRDFGSLGLKRKPLLLEAVLPGHRSVHVHDVKHRGLRQPHLRGDRSEALTGLVKHPGTSLGPASAAHLLG